jgi:hypothetical protein
MSKPSVIEILLIFLGAFFTVLIARSALFDLVPAQTTGKNFMVLTLCIWMLLLVVQFKALRKTIVYLSWMLISLALFALYLYYFSNARLLYLDKAGNSHSYAHGLISPFLMLVLFQICRQISLSTYKFELGLPSKVTGYVYEQKRDATWIDKFYFIGSFGIPIITFYF